MPIPPAEFGNVEIASTSPDVSKVMNDYVVYTFTGDEPTGMYLLGIRLTSPDTGQIIAQSAAMGALARSSSLLLSEGLKLMRNSSSAGSLSSRRRRRSTRATCRASRG